MLRIPQVRNEGRSCRSVKDKQGIYPRHKLRFIELNSVREVEFVPWPNSCSAAGKYPMIQRSRAIDQRCGGLTFAKETPHRQLGTIPYHRCMKPSVSVCMKLTSAFSSSSESPSRPTNFVFMLSVDSGAGQHVVPSPGSLVPQRRRTSRVL